MSDVVRLRQCVRAYNDGVNSLLLHEEEEILVDVVIRDYYLPHDLVLCPLPSPFYS